jgi:hypothetical protein
MGVLTKAIDTDKGKIVSDGCMVTYSGIVFDLMNPDPNLINIEDIAHGLAFTCRWNGHTKRYYSIAEHCLRMTTKAKKELKLTALFHDAEEAYWGDIIKPLKEVIKINSPDIIIKMKELRHLIYEKYNVPFLNIDELDKNELLWDFNNLILKDGSSENLLYPERAESHWIRRYNILKQ